MTQRRKLNLHGTSLVMAVVDDYCRSRDERIVFSEVHAAQRLEDTTFSREDRLVPIDVFMRQWH